MKTKTKTSSRHHRKRVGLHQKRSPDFLKAYHPFIPLLAFVLVALALFSFRPGSSQPKNAPVEEKPQSVLAYATNVSSSGLLASTNQRRTAAGMGGLTLNSKLNSAAQAKANDMANRNYWAHNTPEGNPPWVFINNAGYAYTKAGENLACGFNTSTEVITGWYNSATHKANLLDREYKDVGFGIVNASNYNCGAWAASPQTIIVALYGTPKATQKPAPATPSTPSQAQGSSAGSQAKKSTASNSSSGSSNKSTSKTGNKVDSHQVILTVLNSDGSASKNTKVTLNSNPRVAYTDKTGVVKFDNVEPGSHNVEVEVLGSKSETTIELDGKTEVFKLSIIKPELGANTTTDQFGNAVTPSSQPVSRVAVFSDRFAPWVVSILLILSAVGVIYVVNKHSRAAHKFFVKGEKFVLTHKLIDLGVILLLVSLYYLTRSVGVIL